MMKAIKLSLHIAILSYLAWVIANAVVGRVADPVQYLLHITGLSALRLLLITVAIGPIALWLNKPTLNGYRKMLGLYTFGIALLHLLTYLTFDLQFQWSQTLQAILHRPYITFGFLSLLLLAVLSVSSFEFAKQRLGANWRRVHNLVYVIIFFGLLHFSWSQKTFWDQALYYWLFGFALVYYKLSPLFKGHKK